MNVCTVITPMYYFGRYLGIQPYSFKVVNNVKTAFSRKRDYFYFTFWITLYVLMTVYTIQSQETDEDNFKIVPKYIVLIESGVMVILAYTYLIFAFIFRNSVINSINKICNIDETLKHIEINLQYHKARKKVYKIIIYVTVSVLIRVFMMLNTINITIVEQFMLFLTTLTKSVAKNFIVILVTQVRNRYALINEKIESMFTYETTLIVGISNTKVEYITKMLYVLCRIHYKLRTVIDKIIGASSIQLLMHLGVALSNIIFQAYFLYALLATHPEKISVYYIGSTVTWLADEIYELYTLVEACATTTSTAAETATILHKLRNNIKNYELENHVQMYSLQMLHQHIEFSALGFLSIDYSLLYSIIGAVTTYLVILIQFDQAQMSMSTSRIQENNTLFN